MKEKDHRAVQSRRTPQSAEEGIVSSVTFEELA